MTTVTAPAGALLDPARPSLVRLTAVELRKMVDTRSGRWLLILIALAAVAMMPVVLFAVPEREQTLREFFTASQAGVFFLLPVLGIMSVTSEWSQRTALTTFTLVPDRNRVVMAKVLGGAALGTAFIAVGLVVSVLAKALGEVVGRSDGSWSLPLSVVGTGLLLSLTTVLMGVAFAMLCMNTPIAIVLYFLLPTLWTTLGEMVEKLNSVAGWLDTNRTLAKLSEPGITSGEWARVGTSLLVWMVIPLVAGVIRLNRREVK
ncbi:ABC transporter permease [Spirillospora sp. CA-294931]|uniref:ABC transporter permease n=1 Tax=Spirillospora sp. CA-294931 TaxID=3240042 RepID=UPI003D8D1DFB